MNEIFTDLQALVAQMRANTTHREPFTRVQLWIMERNLAMLVALTSREKWQKLVARKSEHTK